MTPPKLVEPNIAKRTSFVLAVLLVLSLVGWFFYPDSLDHGFFKRMNGSLDAHARAQSLAAFANTRVFDSIAGLVLAAFFLLPSLAFRSGRRRYGMLGFVPAALLFQPWRMFVGWLSGEKPSPGRVFWNDMVRLDEVNAAAKVASDHSFPSDHTAVLLVWATYLTVVGRSGLRWSVWLVVGLLSLPRLLGGGHWLSDVLFGSPLVAIPPLFILFYFDLPDKFLQAVVPRLPKRVLPTERDTKD
jgi:Kdo2-lipid A phosphotransferase